MLNRMRDESGFTLIEAAVAGGLLLVAIIGGISVFDSSRRESATGERQQIAALQAQAEIERMRDLDYSDLEIDPGGTWTPTGAAGDPTNRLGGTTTQTFQVSANQTEELVFAATAGEGVAPLSAVEVPMGDGVINLDVYRFVSWRDEECPVVDLSGVTGTLTGLTDEPETLIGTLLAPGGVLDTLLGPLLSLLGPTVSERLDDARALTQGLDDQVAALVAAIEGIDEIDPCDADAETLNEVETTLEPLSPLLAELDSRINAYHAGCTKLLGVVVSCPGSGSALFTAVNATLTNLENEDFETALEDLVASLEQIESADHTHNTKRVTVAVVLEDRVGSGPAKPVWATSVISDPDEGLLAGP